MVRQKLCGKELLKRNMPLILMALPAVVLMFLFVYVPKFGLILAFKDYSYQEGIFGSPWIGLENFRYIFSSGEIWRAIRNTVGYHFAHTFVIQSLAIIIAVMLYMVSKKASKRYQFVITMPYLASMNIIAAVVYIFLSYDNGIVNLILEALGKDAGAWYTKPEIWPFVLVFVNAWFGAGIKSIYYYSIFMGIDKALFEAVDVDGGTWRHKITHIMLPSIIPILCLFLITDLGNLLASNFALYHAVPMDSSALYSVTDVLSTYEYRGLTMGNIGTTTALGFFTGVVQLISIQFFNGIVRKISPENSLY